MRVIAGKAKSLTLRTIEGDSTRPTTDRIKETLFNMLQPALADCRFLDIFSGSGGIGIEALSRGAAYAVFIENNKRACMCIRQNLSFTKLADHATLLDMDALQALIFLENMNLEKTAKPEPFDIIFMDPPYGKGLEAGILAHLSESVLVGSDTLIIVEEQRQEDFSYVSDLGFSMIRTKEYKTNKHVFLKRLRK